MSGDKLYAYCPLCGTSVFKDEAATTGWSQFCAPCHKRVQEPGLEMVSLPADDVAMLHERLDGIRGNLFAEKSRAEAAKLEIATLKATIRGFELLLSGCTIVTPATPN